MTADYIHNPPNMRIPRNKYFYVILFVKSKSLQMKGQATIYRRKTLDMLFDLMRDIDQIYNHSDVEGDLAYIQQETNTFNVYYKVIYTADFFRVLHQIDKDAYLIKFAWQDIPNTNPAWYKHWCPYPHHQNYYGYPPCPTHCHPCNNPPPLPHPPNPSQYQNMQELLNTNQLIERFGDQE